jgi:hypothetical protein
MMRRFVGWCMTTASLLVLAGLITESSAGQNPPPVNLVAKAPLGLNLTSVNDWSSEIVFVDVFKSARRWISQAKGKGWGQGGPLAVDDAGHVLSLAPDQYAETVVWTDFQKRFPGGIYTAFYDGDGDLDFTGDAKVVKREPGKLTVQVVPNNGSAFARITRTDPKNPLRNIRLVMPGHEQTYLKQPFYPEFLKRWRGFSVFRFMDWQSTNNSKIKTWAERPKLTDHSQAQGRGVCVELMVQLCNELNVSPWFCMPHQADDDYIRQFAQFVRQQLKPGLKVYIEYSNECWNGMFTQARYCADMGALEKLSSNAFEAQLRYYSKRSVEMFKIWQEVYGPQAAGTLVRVLATQSANDWTGSTVLKYNDAARQADAIAIAPYFGGRWGSPKNVDTVLNMTLDQFMQTLREDVAIARSEMEKYAQLARRNRLELIAYEAGQHLAGHGGAENNDQLTQRFHAANRHRAMRDLYRQYLFDWNHVGGGLCCIFASMGNYSKWGAWGLLEHGEQDLQTAPKYVAVREYLDALRLSR